MNIPQTLIFHIRQRLSDARRSTSNRAVSRCFVPEGSTKTLVSPHMVADWHEGGGARIERVIEAAEVAGLELLLVDKRTGKRVLVDVETGEVV
jgi:hypothetical protein